MIKKALFISFLLINIIGGFSKDKSAGYSTDTGEEISSVPDVKSSGTYYVSAKGNDNGRGTVSDPFKTIQRAANVVRPGDVVVIKNGKYSASGEYLLSISRSGTPDKPIVFKSENKWGAVLDGRGKTDHGIIIIKGASNIILEGLEISNFLKHGLVCNDESRMISNITIRGCHIHNIGKVCDSGPYGRDGIYIYKTRNVIFENNLMHDIGRYAHGENGCRTTNRYYENHDHGIYANAIQGLVVRYNIFYNIRRGWALHFYPGASSNISILNNTFDFGNPYREGSHIIFASDLSNVEIKNNIFNGQLNFAIQVDSESYSNIFITNNICFGGKGEVVDIVRRGIALKGNLTNTDPKMVNRSSYDFRLQSKSPAIDKGADVGLDRDYNGKKIGGLPNIGAIE